MSESQNVRGRILDAAFRLLSEHGVAELTQPKVAKAAGVRTSHLTYYFPTRNDLLIESARHCVDTLISGMRESLQRTPGDASLAQLIGDALVDNRVTRIMLSLIVASEEDRAIKSALRALIAGERAHSRELAAVLGLEADEGLLRVCHALALGAAVLNLAQDDHKSREHAREMARFIVDRLIRPAQGRQEKPGRSGAPKRRPAAAQRRATKRRA